MRLTGLALCAVVLLAAMAPAAAAYPELLYATDATACGGCHVDGRGGPLQPAGRGRATTLARGGDGGVLHGAWTPPAWLAIGGVVRVGGAAQRVAIDADFPGYLDSTGAPISAPGTVVHDAHLGLRQAELALHATFDGVTLALRGGLVAGADGEALQLTSRERALGWRRGGLELRAGRFAVPWGLGPTTPGDEPLPDRALGAGAFDAPYAVGAGYAATGWQVAGAAFIAATEAGGAATGARGGALQLWHALASGRTHVGVQGRLDDVAAARRRFVGGLLARHWLPSARLLIQAELDVGRELFANAAPGRTQIAWRAGLSHAPIRGLVATATLHRWEPDLRLRTTARDAFDLSLRAAPWAHIDLTATLRGELRGGDASHPRLVGWLTAGYWL